MIRRYYEEYDPIVESGPKGRKRRFIPNFNHDNISCVDEDAVFLCHCGKNNFGHFLVEYINRSWCLLDKKYKNMKMDESILIKI